MQIVGDATFSFCDRPIGLIGIGLIQPPAKFHPLVFSLVPTESKESYRLAWESFERSAISFVKNFRSCDDPRCTTCRKIGEIIHHENTRELLISTHVRVEKRLPVDLASSDNNKAWVEMVRDRMGLEANKCVAHLTGMPYCSVLCCSVLCIIC